MNSKLTVRELCQIALFAAVIAICAQIYIPLPGMVPFTLQVTAISLAGLVLGPKNGTFATIIYVFLGAVGAPVFAGLSGGMGVIMRHTGGFILSFPLVSLLTGLGARTEKIYWTYAGLTLGTVLNLAIGMLYFSWYAAVSITEAFIAAVAPFLPTSALMVMFVPAISKAVKAALAAARVHI